MALIAEDYLFPNSPSEGTEPHFVRCCTDIVKNKTKQKTSPSLNDLQPGKLEDTKCVENSGVEEKVDKSSENISMFWTISSNHVSCQKSFLSPQT